VRVLGIETSCDETAAAVVADDGTILSNIVHSQIDEHTPFAGVVPEIAARAHVEKLDGVVRTAMETAGLGFAEIDGIAATAGPGLIGGVIVGLATGQSLALATGKPLVAVNHLEAHALTVRMTDAVTFPYLLLLVSGGHCQLLLVEGVGDYRRIGATIDDAAGEAFDKTAKLLGLGYPGGPAVEKRAQAGRPGRFDLPRPMLGRPEADFSFSGLKTAVRRAAESLGPAPSDQDLADLCADFQTAVGDVVADRIRRALTLAREYAPTLRRLVVAGGVAANQYLRHRLEDIANQQEIDFHAPPPALCTDNGAMVAWAGIERLRLGLSDPLDLAPRARWPLDPGAGPLPFAGAKA
jgi:N6-L-threonylcarbamoyladenine synthase